jgi:hypothetical protein
MQQQPPGGFVETPFSPAISEEASRSALLSIKSKPDRSRQVPQIYNIEASLAQVRTESMYPFLLG